MPFGYRTSTFGRAGGAKRAIRNGEVIADEIELRVTGVREQHLVGFETAISRPAMVRTSESARLPMSQNYNGSFATIAV